MEIPSSENKFIRTISVSQDKIMSDEIVWKLSGNDWIKQLVSHAVGRKTVQC